MRIATFNVRGISLEEKKLSLATDFKKYKLDALCIQETHLKGTGLEEFKGKLGNRVKFYFTGSEDNRYHGVGIVVDADRKVLFKRINDRICYVKLLDNNITVICAYSPTNENTKKNPLETLNFYTALNDTTNNFSTKDQVFIAADLNAQLGSHHPEHPDLIGQFHKRIKKT